MSITQLAKTFAVLALAQSAAAHSWVETLQKISSTGSFVGQPGYAMGYINRSDPGFSDDAVENKILDTTTNPVVCKDFAQGDYSNPLYQPLTAAPGDFIAMQYLENGHTTNPTLTPRGFRSGNVMIYGTSEKSTDFGVNDVLYTWNAEGTGGNQKGKLLASHFFDDGSCYQDVADSASSIRAARHAEFGVSELPCQSDFQLPSDLSTSGTYTVFWVWDWPQKPNEVGNTTEIYSSCATINLSSATSNSSAKGVQFVQNSNVMKAAIQSQMVTPIEVLARGTGTAAPAAPTDVQATTTAASAHTTSGAHASSSSKGNKGGIKTVTVTADPETVTQYQTVTVDAGAGGNAQATSTGTKASATASTASTMRTSVKSSSASNPTATGAAVVTSVAPFLRSRVAFRARRAA
ncbi:hypothetical protein BJ170DRAFT_406447 [Xylariales sp. AK1849]|nr:hypothetical protein BJ170DRAFT_406447 [Xylariales sp. AK1849]